MWYIFSLAQPLKYQVFGEVTAGWDVVKHIEKVATDKGRPALSRSTPVLFFLSFSYLVFRCRVLTSGGQTIDPSWTSSSRKAAR